MIRFIFSTIVFRSIGFTLLQYIIKYIKFFLFDYLLVTVVEI